MNEIKRNQGKSTERGLIIVMTLCSEPGGTPLRHYSNIQGMTVTQDSLTQLMIVRKREREKNE